MGACSNPNTIDQFRRGEVMNSRFAMLGVVGMVVPEILQVSMAPSVTMCFLDSADAPRSWVPMSSRLGGQKQNGFALGTHIDIVKDACSIRTLHLHFFMTVPWRQSQMILASLTCHTYGNPAHLSAHRICLLYTSPSPRD